MKYVLVVVWVTSSGNLQITEYDTKASNSETCEYLRGYVASVLQGVIPWRTNIRCEARSE